jgi:hypothetical protein
MRVAVLDNETENLLRRLPQLLAMTSAVWGVLHMWFTMTRDAL